MDRAAHAEPSSKASSTSKVIYIGHLPHGFYERQLKGYFDQFGKVTKVRVSRSKSTTRSRGCAWLQFAHAEVALIAAEASNGYMMHGRTLRCHVVKPDDIHPDLFKNANKKMKRKPWAKLEAERHNKERTPEQKAKRLERLIKRDEARRKMIEAKGIDYFIEPLTSLRPAQSTKKHFL